MWIETKAKQDERWEPDSQQIKCSLDSDEVIVAVRGDKSTEYKGRRGMWKNIEFGIAKK